MIELLYLGGQRCRLSIVGVVYRTPSFLKLAMTLSWKAIHTSKLAAKIAIYQCYTLIMDFINEI
jgi:hypothetical protein